MATKAITLAIGRPEARASILLLILVLLATWAGAEPLIPTVRIGSPGNQSDGDYGGIGYEFDMMVVEVPVDAYVRFLNVAARHGDPFELYEPSLAGSGPDGRQGEPEECINRREIEPGVFEYGAIPGTEWEPIRFVSWISALRFANWLHNGAPSDPLDPETESGSYELSIWDPNDPESAWLIERSPQATWVLPTEDEWYKAAYFKPDDGAPAEYFTYPTRSHQAPRAEPPPGGFNSANYANAVGRFTPVGSYRASSSWFLTLDQAGNALEMTESLVGVCPTLRGSSFQGTAIQMRKSLAQFLCVNELGVRTTLGHAGFRLARLGGDVARPAAIRPLRAGRFSVTSGSRRIAIDGVRSGGTFGGVASFEAEFQTASLLPALLEVRYSAAADHRDVNAKASVWDGSLGIWRTLGEHALIPAEAGGSVVTTLRADGSLVATADGGVRLRFDLAARGCLTEPCFQAEISGLVVEIEPATPKGRSAR